MDMETKTVEIPIDENFQAELDKLKAEGWGLIPGAKNTATYHVCRLKPVSDSQPMGIGRLLIKDEGVLVLPASAHKKN